MADSARLIPGASRTIVRHESVAAVLSGASDDTLSALVEGLRGAAAQDDVAASVVVALGQAAGVNAVVLVSGATWEAVLLGDEDLRAATPAGLTHLNAKNASGVVRQQLSGSVTTVRLGAEGSAAAFSDLTAGVVPGDGLIIEVDSNPAPTPAPTPEKTPPAESAPEAPAVAEEPAVVEEPAEADGQPEAPEPAMAPETEVMPVVDKFDSVPLANSTVERSATRPPLAIGDDEQRASEDEGAGPEPVELEGLNCARGHFNHPEAAHCVWCGLGMAQVSHVLVRGERPPLGVLVVDEQSTFSLDSDYVIGRQPSQHPSVDGVSVRELVLADPDRSVSRVHASISLDGWDVLIEDEGSGNGTWIVDPSGSRPSLGLIAHQPRALMPGEFIHIGPHRLTFHSHHLR